MGLLDFLKNRLSGGNNLQCPVCRTAGAQRTGEGQIRCPNPSCPNFDASLRGHGTLGSAGTTVPTKGSFKPVQPIIIRYRNFAGQDRTFVAEMDSLVRKGDHLVGRVEPTGKKIALARDRIQNLEELSRDQHKGLRRGNRCLQRESAKCSVITRNTEPVLRYSRRFEPSIPTGDQRIWERAAISTRSYGHLHRLQSNMA